MSWAKKAAEEQNNKAAIEALQDLTLPPPNAESVQWVDYLIPQRQYVNELGGGMTHEITNLWPIIKMLIDAEEYSLLEKLNYMEGSMFSIRLLWDDVINLKFSEEIDSMQVPTYIFQGIHDMQTPYSVAKDFAEGLKAPKKHFFTFENSAHSPMMEEPEKFNEIVLNLVREL